MVHTKGKRRTFYDFAFGISQMECIDNIKKHIKRRIRHENYKVLKWSLVDVD